MKHPCGAEKIVEINTRYLQKVSALLFLTLFIKNFKSKLHHFSIYSPCVAMHFSQGPTTFLMPQKKKLVERVATDAPLLSHYHYMKIVFPLKLF
jgi:hypothetical protein